MAPYYHAPPSFDSYTTPPAAAAAANCNNREEVIFSLTERLRQRESQIRNLRQENAELENQLTSRGNPIKLDAAYEEMISHMKERDREFRAETKKQEERQRDLERENRKLKGKVNASEKLLDEQEHNLSLLEREAKESEDEMKKMRVRLEAVMNNADEKEERIIMLEDMVEDLTAEVDRSQNEDNEEKELLARLGDRVENYRHDKDELEMVNAELEHRVQTQSLLLKEKEDEILHMERFCTHREGDLNDDIDQMSHRFREMIESQQLALDERDQEIALLFRQVNKYEDILDEADYVTHEQRYALKANRQEIEKLSMAIEKVQHGGWLGQLDKMCSSGSIFHSGKPSRDGGKSSKAY